MAKGSGPQRGLVQVYSGHGKGKTTAALGLALRAAGHGLKVIVVQFMKDEPQTGEQLFANRYHPFEVVAPAEDRGSVASADEMSSLMEQTLARSRDILLQGGYQVVILDEVLTALDLGYLAESEVLGLMAHKPGAVELVLTGRRAPAEIVRQADLVTEMLMIKHPSAEGIERRKGIDY